MSTSFSKALKDVCFHVPKDNRLVTEVGTGFFCQKMKLFMLQPFFIHELLQDLYRAKNKMCFGTTNNVTTENGIHYFYLLHVCEIWIKKILKLLRNRIAIQDDVFMCFSFISVSKLNAADC